jgi:hypothetical protein
LISFLRNIGITATVNFTKWVLKNFVIGVIATVNFAKWGSFLKNFNIGVTATIAEFSKFKVFLKQFSISVSGAISFLKEKLKIVYKDKYSKQNTIYTDKY